MPFFEWSDKYLLHIEPIDADHKNLFALANRIHAHITQGAGDAAIQQALGQLITYVQQHFDREERMMEQAGYPDLAEHRKTHRMLENIVSSMQRVQMSDPEAIDPDKLLEFLRDWLQNHIIKSDLQYEPWVSKRRKVTNWDLTWSDEPDGVANTEMVEVKVAVPAGKAWIVQECARILESQHWRSEVIEEAALRSRDETLDEDRQAAKAVLR